MLPEKLTIHSHGKPYNSDKLKFISVVNDERRSDFTELVLVQFRCKKLAANIIFTTCVKSTRPSERFIVIKKGCILKVSTKRAEKWCQRKNSIPYFECSAKDNINVEQAFESATRRALQREAKVGQYEDFFDSVDLKNDEKKNFDCCR